MTRNSAGRISLACTNQPDSREMYQEANVVAVNPNKRVSRAKTGAQRAREYRERKKCAALGLVSAPIKRISYAKSAAERMREYRKRKRMLKTSEGQEETTVLTFEQGDDKSTVIYLEEPEEISQSHTDSENHCHSQVSDYAVREPTVECERDDSSGKDNTQENGFSGETVAAFNLVDEAVCVKNEPAFVPAEDVTVWSNFCGRSMDLGRNTLNTVSFDFF